MSHIFLPQRCFRSWFFLLGLLGLLVLKTALADPYVNGTWSPIGSWPISPIHLVLLRNGKVLSYGKSPTIDDGEGFHYDVWDPSLGLYDPISHHTLATQTATNIFCSGQVNIPGTEGDVLIMGGSQVVNGVRNSGTTHTQIFESTSETLHLTGNNMHHARWYPSVTVLGNGNIVAQGGISDLRLPVYTPELYNTRTKTWRVLSNATSTLYRSAWYYPRVFLSTGNNLVLFPRNTNQVWTLNPAGQGSLTRVGLVPGQPFFSWSTATMIDQYTVLIIQGGQQASVVNIRDPLQPTSVATGGLRERRVWPNAVALPNGEVLMVGGASIEQSLAHAVRYAEIWNPSTGVWRVAASAQKSRLYHAAALLLPDATVLVGGGGPPGPETNLDAEIFEPPYLFAADGSRAIRPVISTMGQPGYGQTIAVVLGTAARIGRVSLMRLGSVTHSFNMEERAVSLQFEQPTLTTLNIMFTTDRSAIPPGWYMLFVVNDLGVPSVSRIVSLP